VFSSQIQPTNQSINLVQPVVASPFHEHQSIQTTMMKQQLSKTKTKTLSSSMVDLMMIMLMIIVLSVSTVHALPQYASRIPNGYSVPNPGPQGGVWAGVGHENAAGGGPNNQFGLDFQQSGHTWSVELCMTDSDGDGRSNGIELGDPDCIWYEGSPDGPEFPALSHPGIVDEPLSEEQVKHSCDDYVKPDDEVTLDLAFTNPNSMDSSQTHYICEQKVVDVSQLNGKVYHQIKESVLLDNSNVLHHMFVYLCPPGVVSTDGDRVGEGQYSCDGIENGCERIAGWAVGPHETCEPPNVGQRRDLTSTTELIIKIEAHYDNTSGQSQLDQSGMKIHLTPTLRPLESSVFMTGMVTVNKNFLIPPGQTNFELSNICPTAIMDNLQHPIYVYSFYPHMHLYGRTLKTDLYRCGQKIAEVGRIDSYEFDNQQSYILPKPIKVLPGDALVTTCTYNSTSTNVTIYGGEETVDEMCLNFMGVYPDPRSTATSSSFLEACTSFENGVSVESDSELPSTASGVRFAIGDRSRTTITQTFESDPTLNIGSCCAATTAAPDACDELYMANEGEACGIDSDCAGEDLVCNGGLCSASEQLSGTTDDGSSSSTSTPDAEEDDEKEDVEENDKDGASGTIARIGDSLYCLFLGTMLPWIPLTFSIFYL
jgi:dopamine beta-monooxygenase